MLTATNGRDLTVSPVVPTYISCRVTLLRTVWLNTDVLRPSPVLSCNPSTVLSCSPSPVLPAVTGLTEGAVEVPGVGVTEVELCDESAVVVAK